MVRQTVALSGFDGPFLKGSKSQEADLATVTNERCGDRRTRGSGKAATTTSRGDVMKRSLGIHFALRPRAIHNVAAK